MLLAGAISTFTSQFALAGALRRERSDRQAESNGAVTGVETEATDECDSRQKARKHDAKDDHAECLHGREGRQPGRRSQDSSATSYGVYPSRR